MYDPIYTIPPSPPPGYRPLSLCCRIRINISHGTANKTIIPLLSLPRPAPRPFYPASFNLSLNPLNTNLPGTLGLL